MGRMHSKTLVFLVSLLLDGCIKTESLAYTVICTFHVSARRKESAGWRAPTGSRTPAVKDL